MAGQKLSVCMSLVLKLQPKLAKLSARLVYTDNCVDILSHHDM